MGLSLHQVQLVLSLQAHTWTLLRVCELHKALLVVCSCHAVQDLVGRQPVTLTHLKGTAPVSLCTAAPLAVC